MVQHIADHVLVMSQGRIVESQPCDTLIDKPEHVYTKKLLRAFRV